MSQHPSFWEHVRDGDADMWPGLNLGASTPLDRADRGTRLSAFSFYCTLKHIDSVYNVYFLWSNLTGRIITASTLGSNVCGNVEAALYILIFIKGFFFSHHVLRSEAVLMSDDLYCIDPYLVEDWHALCTDFHVVVYCPHCWFVHYRCYPVWEVEKDLNAK